MKEQALVFLQNNIRNASFQAKKISWKLIETGRSVNTLGLLADHEPFEGTIFGVDDQFVAFKIGRKAQATIMDRRLLPERDYEIGEKHFVTPYRPVQWDGLPLGQPRGNTYIIGESTHIHLPEELDPYSFMGQLKDQLQIVTGKHGYTSANFMADAGAWHHEVTVFDDDESCYPYLEFTTSNPQGKLRVTLDRGSDTYHVQFGSEKVEDAFFEDLPDVIADLLGIGPDHFRAKVTVLKKASKTA